MIEAAAVIGMEGSGTQWMTWALVEHPEIAKVLHQSYPTAWSGSPYKRLCEYGPWDGCQAIADCTAPVIVMMRDRTCSARSNRNRGFFDVDPKRKYRALASEEMWQDIHRWRGPVLPVSYEGLVEHAENYLGYILQWLGVDARRYPWEKFNPHDANEKYLA